MNWSDLEAMLMQARLPTRFGLRTLLLLVALCAVAALCIREWTRLQVAHQQFERATSLYFGASQITLREVVDAAEPVYEVESSTVWMSQTVANVRQRRRLSELLEHAESFVMNTMFGDKSSWEDAHRQCERLRAKIDELDE